ncbi:hypothetical protein XELAEV_18010896mg [Xenopus laevis]|uniref:Uncharacterized protein n=1 Tax=Xenopus laevis TaxID=8355 RepID=A0A974I263_XENLA|nr:hypothetical protein XELAEV_18010896mg [Xenopus laevis]
MSDPEQSSEQLGANTFAYSDAEIQRILSEIEEGDIPLSGTTNVRDVKRELLNLQKKEIGLNLHITSLAQYVRNKRIPRGLRVDLKPNLCADDPVLKQRWQEICNKCSLDLIVLTIERLQVKVSTIRKSLSDVKEEIQREKGADQLAAILRDHEETLHRYRESISVRKQSKFDRDAQDYRQNQVYSWREERSRQQSAYYSPPHRSGRPRRGYAIGRAPDNFSLPYPATQRREQPTSYRGNSGDRSSSSDVSGGGFLDQDITQHPPKRRNPRAPIPREQYPNRQRSRR